jgi:DNA-binding SARP family transcriptional activator
MNIRYNMIKLETGEHIVNKEYVLQVKMFDGFSMGNDVCEYRQDNKRAKQVSALIAYLIANRDAEITKTKLVDALWPDESSDNPDGALRNLVYRARAELKKFFPYENIECILRKNDTYIWNPQVEMIADIDLFEQYHRAAYNSTDHEARYMNYIRAIETYKGDFLPEFSGNSWVMFRAMYYGRRYIESVLAVCEYLMEKERYQDVIELCEKATKIEQVYEKIHEFYLRALEALGEIQRAIDYYYYVVDLLYCKLGVEVSESLRAIYSRIIEKLPEYQVNIEKLENRLKDSDVLEGSYYCNYEVFKSIYQVNVRAVRRSRGPRYLVLLTIEEEIAGTIRSESYKEEMSTLRKVIHQQLRKNDVFTQFSATQYSLILSAQSEENCEVAIGRIVDKFKQKNKVAGIRITWELKRIQ